MLEALQDLDTRLALAINGAHSPALDKVMLLISEKFFWIPVYLLLLYLLYKRYSGRQFLLVLGAVALCIAVCDRLAVELFKETVARYRPSHNLLIKEQIHLVTDFKGQIYRGGLYGFFSNHASNYSALAVLCWRLLAPMRMWAAGLLLLWVAVICYSRVYLGVHYPSDIAAGLVYGSAAGWLISLLFFYTRRKIVKT